MNLGILLGQIAVEHGTEDGASHGEHVLQVGGGKGEGCVRTSRISSPTNVSQLQNFRVLTSGRAWGGRYLVRGDPLRLPGGPNDEVDIGHQLVVKHQRVPEGEERLKLNPNPPGSFKHLHSINF